MKIVILTDTSFPIGLAATNRIQSYCKGFFEKGVEIKVICLKPTEKPPNFFNKISKGNFNGVEFEYTSGKTLVGKNFWERRLENIKGIFNASIKLSSETKADVIIIYTKSLTRILFFFLYAKFKNIIFLKEESEFPFSGNQSKNILKKFYSHIFMDYSYKLYDGMLIMTKTLMDFYEKRVHKKAKRLHVPMTVDYERFSECSSQKKVEKYIACCGVLNEKKDGMFTLVRAFSKVAKIHKDFKLYLIGSTDVVSDMEILINEIKVNQLEEKVILTGRVARNEMPNYLCNSSILVLARPKSKQAEGGFPTKLGEYLATGVPVVITKVGDIPDYLKDGENAFLIEPNSVKDCAEKLLYVIENYTLAEEIGKKGKETALKYFNYKTQTDMIIDFIKEFKV